MKSFIHFLLFKVIWMIYQMGVAAESLVSGFIRYVYIPVFHSNLNSSKIIKDLTALDKKPNEQLTFVFEIRSSKASDIRASASKIVRYGRIVEEAINPHSFSCYLDTSFIKEEEMEELRQILNEVLIAENSKLKVLFSTNFNYREKISEEKSTHTPLVIIFSSYPSILGLHPSYLIGAQITFRPQVLKSTDYDLYSSLQSYAASEQRKGK